MFSFQPDAWVTMAALSRESQSMCDFFLIIKSKTAYGEVPELAERA